MSDKAIEALEAFDVWDSMNADRGGHNGPKGKAWQKFLKLKNEALDECRYQEPQINLNDLEERLDRIERKLGIGFS